MKNLLLICGGTSSEHEVSLRSADYIQSQIDKSKFNILRVTIEKDGSWLSGGAPCLLDFNKNLIVNEASTNIDLTIPCIHGVPGESGDIQSFFEMIDLPYFGAGPETSTLCFNKLSTKLWLEGAGIKTVPFIAAGKSKEQLTEGVAFLKEHGSIYVKATNQGSSIGCYQCSDESKLSQLITKAFSFSPFVILEKEIKGRELEVATFEYKGELIVTKPSEVICPTDFYSYEEKYNNDSKTETHIEAKNVSKDQLSEITRQATIAYELFGITHLSRMDFFISNDNIVYLSEINTFPGHTAISMFPLMMENYGIKYEDYINVHLQELAQY